MESRIDVESSIIPQSKRYHLRELFLQNNFPSEIIYLIYAFLSPEDLSRVGNYFDIDCLLSNEGQRLWEAKFQKHFSIFNNGDLSLISNWYDKFKHTYAKNYGRLPGNRRLLWSLVIEEDAESLRKQTNLATRNPRIVHFSRDEFHKLIRLPSQECTTLVDLALYNKNQAVLDIFYMLVLSQNPDLSNPEALNYTFMYAILFHQRRPELQRLFDLHADPNGRWTPSEPNSHTPLACAAIAANVEGAQFLLENKANPHLLAAAASNHDEPPLFTCIRNKAIDVARAILQHDRTTINTACDGFTPLHLAAKFGRIDFLKLFLEFGLDINACPTTSGITALCAAASSRKEHAFLFLLEQGAAIPNNDLLDRVMIDFKDDDIKRRIINLYLNSLLDKILQPFSFNYRTRTFFSVSTPLIEAAYCFKKVINEEVRPETLDAHISLLAANPFAKAYEFYKKYYSKEDYKLEPS